MRANLFDRKIYDTWVKDGAKRFEERLREKTAALMKHQPAPLPEGVRQELERMAGGWE